MLPNARYVTKEFFTHHVDTRSPVLTWWARMMLCVVLSQPYGVPHEDAGGADGGSRTVHGCRHELRFGGTA